MLKTKSVKGLAVAVVAVGALLGTAGAASAYVYGDYTTSDVKIRSGTSQSTRILGSGYPGDHEYDFCYKTGQTIYGNVFWDLNEDAYSGTTGYSSEYYLTSGASQFTAC
jgi:hypothetical protein